MSDNKIMPWIDELEGAAATDFPARRDEIAAMMGSPQKTEKIVR